MCWYPISLIPYEAGSFPDIFSFSPPRQAFLALLIGIDNYCTLNMQYSLASALLVAVGLYTTQECPRLMGRLREVSTVRDFWGKFWRKSHLLAIVSICFETWEFSSSIWDKGLSGLYLFWIISFGFNADIWGLDQNLRRVRSSNLSNCVH